MSDHTHDHSDYCGCPSAEVIAHGCRADIARVGWHAVGVRGSDVTPEFVYTVGLVETTGQPDLVIAGLPANLGHSLLVALVQLIKDGQELVAGERVSDVVAGMDVGLRELPDPCALTFNVADGYYGKPQPRLQLVWPDAEGRLPDDSGVDEDVDLIQDIFV